MYTLLTKEKEVPVNGKTMEWYLSKGYVIPTYWSKKHNKFLVKRGTTILVNSSDLPHGSHEKVEVSCDYCGKIRSIAYKDYLSQHDDEMGDCCKSCEFVKCKKTMLDKYGVDNSFEIPDIIDKIIATNREKYGCDWQMQSARVKEKSVSTMISKYGVKKPLQKEEFLNKVFPQAKVMLEYRGTEAQINFDNRIPFGQPFFILIDELWKTINLRNGAIPVREGSYIFDIPFFNEDVIREIVNNAFAHRDYRKNSEIVIKQYPNKLVIQNAGGFPQGVTLDNLLTVPSTPRNRLLADVLSKTGVVERSGQGMDKIFLYTLSEGKPAPDYSYSDDFTVTGILLATVKDKAFAMYVQGIQQELPDEKKLTVFDVMALCEVRDGAKHPADKQIAHKLEQLGYLEKHGKTNAQYYILPRTYYELSGNIAKYSLITDWDVQQVWAVVYPFLVKYGKAKKSDIVTLCGNHLSDKQLRKFIDELKSKGMLKTEGERGQMVYLIGDSYLESNEIMNRALEIGLKELINKGEITKGE